MNYSDDAINNDAISNEGTSTDTDSDYDLIGAVREVGENKSNKKSAMFCVKVDGFSQEWKPDTVAARNIMDEEHFLSFENKLGRKIKLSPSSIKLFAFGNRQNLNIIGKFNAVLRAGVRSVYSTIFVTKERYQYPLLCEDSLYKLGLISFNKKFITYQMKRTRRSVVINQKLKLPFHRPIVTGSDLE